MRGVVRGRAGMVLAFLLIFFGVKGLGDYLPTYAGNLDIMTAAAAPTAEMFAVEILAGKLTLEPIAA